MTLSLKYKGYDYVDYYNGAYGNADSLADLRASGSTSAEMSQEYGINANTSQIYIDANYTDSLAALGNEIQYANALGVSVMVRPLIDFVNPSVSGGYSQDQWRAYYKPTNVAAFFASYKTMIVAQAQVAQANGAASLSIGTEIDQLTGPAYLSYWTDIINSIRAVYSGKLTYSAIWDDNISPWQYGGTGLPAGTGNLATQVSFWNQLDYVGIDDYAPLSDVDNPTLAQLVAGWTQIPTDPTTYAVTGNQSLIQYFEGIAAATGKPLIFTELGYESASDAAIQPFFSSPPATFDPDLQAKLYQSFFSAWRQAGNSSLTGVYFWDWDPNTSEVGPGGGINFSTQGLPAQGVATNGFATQHDDFAGVGQADILLQQNDGQAAIWLMNGLSLLNGYLVSAAGAGATLLGAGDFNGDGEEDILMQSGVGQSPVAWLMNGTSVTSAVTMVQPDPGWVFDAIGDFNGDGTSDQLWRSPSDGSLQIWLVNDAVVTNENPIAAVPGSNWNAVATGDFNGDGKADILFQNTNDGTPAIWLMDGNDNIAAAAELPSPSLIWRPIGVGDFNGDGLSDILWQESDNGQLAIWEMSGLAIADAQYVDAIPGPTWIAKGVGDYNGDGMSDILFQNTNGQVAVWEMNGFSIAGASVIANPGNTWTTIGG